MRRVTFYLPWLAVATAVAILSTAALSLAGSSPPPEPPESATAQLPVPVEEPLVVPDVRGQPYVFAKGILEDAGFAWRIKGKAKGYPANVVVSQKPSPGTLLSDTGAPTLVLRLQRNTDYEQNGLPKDSSPYPGTKNVLWDDGSDETPPSSGDPATEAPPAAPPSGSEHADDGQTSDRPPAFVAPGAPPEPPDEITLVARADKLAGDLAGQEQTPELVDHWLFQHEWIVTGAKFGWYGGEEALLKLIAIDEDLQSRWGIGAKSAEVARQALDEVRAEIAEAAPDS